MNKIEETGKYINSKVSPDSMVQVKTNSPSYQLVRTYLPSLFSHLSTFSLLSQSKSLTKKNVSL